jgi:hypothetical protein
MKRIIDIRLIMVVVCVLMGNLAMACSCWLTVDASNVPCLGQSVSFCANYCNQSNLTFSWSIIQGQLVGGTTSSCVGAKRTTMGQIEVRVTVWDRDGHPHYGSKSVGVKPAVVAGVACQAPNNGHVWKGTEVTCQVTTDPPGLYGGLEVSKGQIDTGTGQWTFVCSPSSGTSCSPAFEIMIKGCSGQWSTYSGPTVYELMSASCQPDVVCQGQGSQVVPVISPAGCSPPDIVFDGDNITPGGFIAGTPILDAGTYEYTATAGSTTKTAKLIVLTGLLGDWTNEYIPQFEFPHGPGPYERMTALAPRSEGGVIEIWRKGSILYSPFINKGDWLLQSECSMEVPSMSEEYSYNWGLSADYVLWETVVIHGGVGYSGTYTHTYTIPAEEGRRHRIAIWIPGVDVVHYYEWWAEHHIPEEGDSYWVVHPMGFYQTETSFCLDGADFHKQGACCPHQ